MHELPKTSLDRDPASGATPWLSLAALFTGLLLLPGLLWAQTDSSSEDALAQSAAAGTDSSPASGLSSDQLYDLLTAEIAVRQGELKLAATSYLAAARRTRDASVAERAVRVALFAREEALALEGSALWSELAPDDVNAIEIGAALQLRVGDIDDAVAAFARLVERLQASDEGEAGSEPGAYARIAETLGRETKQDAALAVMEKLAAMAPGDAQAQGALGQMLARAGKLDRAAEVFERLVAIAPEETLDSEQSIIFYARILQQQDKLADALAALEVALERKPDANAVRMTYARLLVEAQRTEDAIAQFKLLAENEQTSLDARYALGLLYLQSERYEESREQFEALTRNVERRETAWYYLGQIAESQKKLDDAITAYRKVDDEPNRTNARVRIAVLLGEQGKTSEARSELHALQARNTQDSVRLYRAEAEILTRADDYEGAMAVYDRALEEHPIDTDLLYSRALLAERMDRIDQVERDLRDILGREPSNPDVLNALGYTLADRTDRFEEALELIARALELKPDDHYVMDSMGWVLFRMGRAEDAIGHLRRAMALQPDPEIAAHLGEVLWSVGRKDEARKVWDDALAESPDDERLLEVRKRFGL